MKSRLIFLSLALLLLLSFSTGCAMFGVDCAPPSVDFEKASEAVRNWVGACLAGRSDDASEYWTATYPEMGAQECEFLHSLREYEETNIEIESVSVEDHISFLCLKQLWVTLRRKDDGRTGLLVVFVANADTNPQRVVLYGVMYGALCPRPDILQREYFDNCFWVAAE